MYKFQFIVLLALTVLFGACSAVDIELAREGPCLDPPPEPAPYDEAVFINTSLVWYHHYWGKYYLYNVAKELTRKEFEDITDKDIKNSCLTFAPIGQGNVNVTGFSGHRRNYELGAGNTEKSFNWKAGGKPNWDGEGWITKAGSDYFVIVSCFATNERAVTVGALKKTLSVKKRLELLDHIRSLGFDPKYIFEQNFENCVDKQSQTNGNGNTPRPPRPQYGVPSQGYYYTQGGYAK